MRRIYTNCPSGDWEIRHVAYSGCSDVPYRVTPEEVTHELAKIARRARRNGYPVTVSRDTGLRGNLRGLRVEIESPDDAAMVGDVEGAYFARPAQVPAVECHKCGEAVAIGET